MRIACFSPLPPQKSGIADYTAELLPELRRHMEVDTWLPQRAPEPSRTSGRVVRYSAADVSLADLAGYDVLLYHLGNNADFHAESLELFYRYPGVVVLHDLVLHHLQMVHLVGRLGSPASYLEELAYEYGDFGHELGRRVLAGESLLPAVDADHLPLNGRVVDVASAVIVHSRFAADRLRTRRPDLPVACIHHHGFPQPPPADPQSLRADLGLPAQGVLLGAFGHFVSTKRLDVLLVAFAALADLTTHLVLVGEPLDPWLELAAHLGVAERVHGRNWVDLPVLERYLAAVDVVVNLRHPSMGETSGIACRALAAGKPCVVSRSGWFDELPDGVAVKVPLGAGENNALVVALDRLVADTEERARCGEAARRHSAQENSPEQTARGYAELLSTVAGRGEAARRDLLDQVGGALEALGVDDRDSGLVRAVGERLSDLFPRLPPVGRR